MHNLSQVISRWRFQLLLFLFSIGIYSLYFSHVFLHLNGILSSIVDDSLKNYFTYTYQIKNSSSLLNFSGFNYPYGEHVVYTDCQPLLTFILHALPFTHNYAIGILHFLIFFSIIITPSILFSIFSRLELPAFPSFFISLAVTLLSPQFHRIYCGHYALAYTCVIPLSILLLFRYFDKPSKSSFVLIFSYNSLLFLIHPYLGLGLSLFTFISIGFYSLLSSQNKIRNSISAITLGLFPIILFKLFMFLTDKHPDRPIEPIGNDEFISNAASFLIPYFGPFKLFLETTFHLSPAHFEGYTYLGIASIVIFILFIISFPFLARKYSIRKGFLAILFASSILLLFSFGIQFKVQELLHFKIAALNQFRAMGRFSWFLYFTLPLLIFPFFYQTLQGIFSLKTVNRLFVLISLGFFSVNLVEAHYYFHMYDGIIWEDRNFFNEDKLNYKEKEVIAQIKASHVQAIVPLPMFYVGSEMYDRTEFTFPLIVSTIYAYHCNLPIVAQCASRSSISETANGIEILNSYKLNKDIEKYFSNQSFFITRPVSRIRPDEERLFSKVKVINKNDSTIFGLITRDDLLKPVFDKRLIEISQKSNQLPDTNGVVYIEYLNKKPYQLANQLNYEMAFVLDSNILPSGEYNVSLHYHTQANSFRNMSNALIVTRTNGPNYAWQNVFPLKLISASYPGYTVSENLVNLEKGIKYEFLIKGNYDLPYKISHFLLRPIGTSVMIVNAKKDTIYNNYPLR